MTDTSIISVSAESNDPGYFSSIWQDILGYLGIDSNNSQTTAAPCIRSDESYVIKQLFSQFNYNATRMSVS